LGTCNTVHMVARDWVSRKLKESSCQIQLELEAPA
jgi:hypothetical protein